MVFGDNDSKSNGKQGENNVIFIKKNRFYATETLLGLLIRNVRLKKMR
jgi:hypothetical protein